MPSKGTRTRWVSPENMSGQQGKGGSENAGAKGNPYILLSPYSTETIFNVRGSGLIRRIWMTGNFTIVPELRRMLRIDMYWDNMKTPAVSAPLVDFFGMGLAIMRPFENDLFSSPEARSLNCTIPMPFRTSAQIEISNESPYYVMLFYDISYLEVTCHDTDVLYFHSYWHRNLSCSAGVDFKILPKIVGRGRFIGSNIGIIGNTEYSGTWIGEGEVKIYLDGDAKLATLVGTGTEDYIGTGWGQGEFQGRYQGSLLSGYMDSSHELYSFYRFHTDDPVYFDEDCCVTIQIIGSASTEKLRSLSKVDVFVRPVGVIERDKTENMRSRKAIVNRLLASLDPPADIMGESFPIGSTNFYRAGDDYSSTAYFYLDRPSNNLPPLAALPLRTAKMDDEVFGVVDPGGSMA